MRHLSGVNVLKSFDGRTNDDGVGPLPQDLLRRVWSTDKHSKDVMELKAIRAILK